MVKAIAYFPFLLLLLFSLPLPGQEAAPRPFLEPADTFDRSRFILAAGGTATAYGIASVGLYHAWYKDHELSGFHTFNDAGEWMQVDKMGHMFTTYNYSFLAFKGTRWTGVEHNKAAWMGVGVGMLLQTTVEVFDGFSEKWGFSWSDMAFNTLGAGLFLGQQLGWQEQRIVMKFSNSRPSYSTEPIPSRDGNGFSNVRERAHDLFGATYAEAFLKDYNGATNWFSVNPSSFILPKNPDSRFPRWLNIAVGYGAQNMYGGYQNTWSDGEGNQYAIDSPQEARYRQFYLSLDIDLTRIKTNSRLLRTLFTLVNWIKVPAPTLEFNTRGEVKAYPVFW